MRVMSIFEMPQAKPDRALAGSLSFEKQGIRI